jgi:hypothetical protein
MGGSPMNLLSHYVQIQTPISQATQMHHETSKHNEYEKDLCRRGSNSTREYENEEAHCSSDRLLGTGTDLQLKITISLRSIYLLFHWYFSLKNLRNWYICLA